MTIIAAKAKAKFDGRLADGIRTCEAITDNLRAKGYEVDLSIIITDKKTGIKREIKI